MQVVIVDSFVGVSVLHTSTALDVDSFGEVCDIGICLAIPGCDQIALVELAASDCCNLQVSYACLLNTQEVKWIGNMLIMLFLISS